MHVVESRGAERFSPPRQVDVAAARARRDGAGARDRRRGACRSTRTRPTRRSPSTARPLGKGVWEGPLPAGEHEVTIEAAGFRPYRRAFLVHAGRDVRGGCAPREHDSGRWAPLRGPLLGARVLRLRDALRAPRTASQRAARRHRASHRAPSGPGSASASATPSGGSPSRRWPSGPTTTPPRATRYAVDGASDVARSESYGFHRFGGGAALGARVASKDPHLRFTGAVLGGFATMANIYKQDATAIGTTGTSEQTSSTKTYTAPLAHGRRRGARRLGERREGSRRRSSRCSSSSAARCLRPLSLRNPSAAARSRRRRSRSRRAPRSSWGPMIGFDFGL